MLRLSYCMYIYIVHYCDAFVFFLFCGSFYILGFIAIFVLFGALSLLLGTLIAAESLHWNVLSNVLRIHLQFFDTNPIGRVLNRFSKDVDTLDNVLPMTLRGWFMCIGQVGRVRI